MSFNKEKHIIHSWIENAKPWISAINNNEIKSRILATNKAIVESILERQPQKVLDIGCGEGWLAKTLSKAGIEVYGIDIVPELVEQAKQQGGGTFQVLSYEALSKGAIKEKFDLAVCNFSLLGKASVHQVFQSIPSLLNQDGFFIVQTIHPLAACGKEAYKDGWREGSWAGFNNQFTNPPPWYFRTLETWKALFKQNKISLSQIVEPLNPVTNTFASIIFIGSIKKEI